MFIAGFCASSTLMTTFLFANTDDTVTCSGRAHYIEQSEICVIQAFCLVFCFSWVVCWSVIFSLDVYHQVVSLTPHYDSSEYHWRYTMVAVVVSLIIAVIPFAAGNLGFDPEANIPICFYLISHNEYYFWYTFFTPLCILIVSCTAITIVGMYKIQRIYTNSREYDEFMRLQRLADRDNFIEKGSYLPPVAGLGHPHLRRGPAAGQGSHSSSHFAPLRATIYDDEADDDCSDISWSTHSKSVVGSGVLAGANAGRLSSTAQNAAATTADGRESVSSVSTSASTVAVGASVSPQQSGEDPCTLLSNPVASGRETHSPDNEADDDELSLASSSSVSSNWSRVLSEEHGRSQLQGGRTDESGRLLLGHARGGHARRDETEKPAPSHWLMWLWSRHHTQQARGGYGEFESSSDMASESTEQSPDFASRGSDLSDSALSVTAATLLLTWQRNWRSILFVSIFCMTGIYVMVALFNIYGIKYDFRKGVTTEFIECLVEAAHACTTLPITQEGVDACAAEACGTHPSPRPNSPLVSEVLPCSLTQTLTRPFSILYC